MKIFLTGAKGYIGKHLTKALRKAKNEVHEHDIISSGTYPWGDVDLVMHLGTHSRAYESVINPDKAITNIAFTYEVLEWMRRNMEYPKIIFSSSREVVSMESPYGASKAASEALINAYCNSYGFSAVNLRLPNIYGGTGEHPDRFIPLTIQQAKANKEIIIYGEDKKLNFVYIDDCVKALIDVLPLLDLGKYKSLSLVYKKSYSLVDIAKLIIKLTNSKSDIKILPSRAGETKLYLPPTKNIIETDIDIERGLKLCLA